MTKIKSLSFRRRREFCKGLALLLLLSTLNIVIPSNFAYANGTLGEFTDRSVDISSSAVGATSLTYTIDITTPVATTDIEGIRILFCSNSPIIADSCTAPTDFDASAYTIDGQTFSEATNFTAQTTNENDCTVATATNDEFEICLERTDADNETAAAKQIVLGGIENPSTLGTFYVRVTAYDNNNFTTDLVFNGSMAIATANQIDLTARVQEEIAMTVGTDPDADDCSSISGTDVDLGVLFTTINRLSTDPSGGNINLACVEVLTNAANGLSVSYIGDDLKVSGATCSGSTEDDAGGASDSDQCLNRDSDAGAGSSTAITANDEQWGMAVKSTPDNGSTTDNLSATSAYDGEGSNEFSFTPNTVTQIGSSSTVVSNESLEIEMAGTASTSTPTGVYTTTLTFIATATY